MQDFSIIRTPVTDEVMVAGDHEWWKRRTGLREDPPTVQPEAEPASQ